MPEREPESGIPEAARAMARSGRKEAFPPRASPRGGRGRSGRWLLTPAPP